MHTAKHMSWSRSEHDKEVDGIEGAWGTGRRGWTNEVLGGLTLPPLPAVGVQVVGIQAVRFVQSFQHFPDVHHLNREITINTIQQPWINTINSDFMASERDWEGVAHAQPWHDFTHSLLYSRGPNRYCSKDWHIHQKKSNCFSRCVIFTTIKATGMKCLNLRLPSSME